MCMRPGDVLRPILGRPDTAVAEVSANVRANRTSAGDRKMARLLAAAVLLTVAAAPSFACDGQKSTSTDAQQRTVASQPAYDHSTPPPSMAAGRKSS
jgi:hypothetical protein